RVPDIAAGRDFDRAHACAGHIIKRCFKGAILEQRDKNSNLHDLLPFQSLKPTHAHASIFTRRPVAADSIAPNTIARLLILSWHSPIGVAPVASACRKSRS